MKRQAWTQHVFNLNLDPGWVHNVITRLEGTAVLIEKYCMEMEETELEVKLNGKWSVKEEIGHLIDLEPLHHKRLEEFAERIEVLSAADMSNTATENANHNSRSLSELIHDFKEGRSAFIQTYQNLPEDCLYHEALHPRLKVPMKPIDLLFFVAEHDDHHLTNIKHIVRTLRK